MTPLWFNVALAAPLPDVGSSATWIGTQSVVGVRSIPLIGTVEFRTDSRVLATVSRTSEGRIELVQRVCGIVFSRALGAEMHLDPTAPRAMAPTRLAFDRAADGSWLAGPWPSGWTADDHDHDGHPGITVRVKAPVCGGGLHVASTGTNHATAPADPRSGHIKVWVEQDILGSEGACLRIMARDRDEWLEGRYRYEDAPAASTCDTITEWPNAWAD